MLDILFLKFFLTIIIVLILFLIVEYINPKTAGLISGIPTGTAIILFFYGLELGTDFASKSALFNLAGILSLLIFIFTYYKLSLKFNFFISSFLALILYFLSLFILKQIHLTLLTALIIPLISIPIFLYLFKDINNKKLNKKEKSIPLLIFRSFLASLIVLFITFIAKFTGPELGGLLSSFPITIFPLILVVHFTYGKEYTPTIIKNIPLGLLAIIPYSLGIFVTYPLFGIYLGTLISYLLVVIYLLLYFYRIKIKYFFQNKFQ